MARRLPDRFDEKADRALQLMRSGASVREACRAVGIDKETLRRNVDEDTYKAAREEGFIAQADEVHDLEQALLRGEVDPQAARVAIDARKWRLGKMSRFLADKPQAAMQLNIQNNVGTIDPTEALKQIMAMPD